MRNTALVVGLGFSLLVPTVFAAPAPAPAKLTAAQIVEKNVAARGGLSAWRAVRSISFTGKMEAGGKENPQLPFTMELKRPHMSRVEIEFANDRAVQVYDGANGWKVRPFLGRREVEPFTADELKAAAMDSELDGPLVDCAAKGTTVTLAGTEKVDGRDTYKLELALKGGQVRHVWIDAGTFLEAKIEGVPRRMDGKPRPVEIAYHDFRPVDGVVVPHVLETTVKGIKDAKPHKTVIETVVVNPALDDARFTRQSLSPEDAPAPVQKAANEPGRP
ncbi:MAG: outer membrane lipoprotein-sorting protein [Acidobacteria bacterium]|nr:outer membrane lipoprotein-sorting protein [Acidobacteriota bacterium]